MDLIPTELAGVYEVRTRPHVDERGSFTRVHCARSLAALAPGQADLRFVQTNLSRSTRRGTLRGLHFQRPPSTEAKLIRCLRGAVWDVAVDLRAGSPTRGRWLARELTADNQCQLFLPPGVAHGFQTLADDSELLYQHTAEHDPALDSGVHHADPRLAIPWPLPPVAVSARDAGLPGLADVAWG